MGVNSFGEIGVSSKVADSAELYCKAPSEENIIIHQSRRCPGPVPVTHASDYLTMSVEEATERPKNEPKSGRKVRYVREYCIQLS